MRSLASLVTECRSLVEGGGSRASKAARQDAYLIAARAERDQLLHGKPGGPKWKIPPERHSLVTAPENRRWSRHSTNARQPVDLLKWKMHKTPGPK